jgi:hypothetical protein
MVLTALRAGDQYILWFNISVNDLESVEMSKPSRDLAQCTFRIKRDCDVHETIRVLDNVCEGRGAEFDGDVKEIRLSLLIEVPDDVGMIVRFLKDTDFSGGQGDKVLEETFDCHSTALQCALENDSSVGTVT